jgi:hypothetical protein
VGTPDLCNKGTRDVTSIHIKNSIYFFVYVSEKLRPMFLTVFTNFSLLFRQHRRLTTDEKFENILRFLGVSVSTGKLLHIKYRGITYVYFIVLFENSNGWGEQILHSCNLKSAGKVIMNCESHVVFVELHSAFWRSGLSCHHLLLVMVPFNDGIRMLLKCFEIYHRYFKSFQYAALIKTFYHRELSPWSIFLF